MRPSRIGIVIVLAAGACRETEDPREGRHVPEGYERQDPPADPDTGEPDPDSPHVTLLSPEEAEVAENPVTFSYEVTGDGEIAAVDLTCEGWLLHEEDLPADPGVHSYTYDFNGVNYEREVVLTGYDDQGDALSQDAVTFIPDEGWLPEEAGFNGYVVQAINDTSLYPKDASYPYCWSYYGDVCGESWGMIWGSWYQGSQLFPGGYDCFCSGHTLEMFFYAYELWQEDNGAATTDPYGGLTFDDAYLGDFYQYWQGYGVATYASAADAFEYAGIGERLYEDRWEEATTGDFVNLSRSTGSGHSVLFVYWIYEGDEIVGLRYYGCNGSGDSHPYADDPDNISDVSGPSFVTEYFEGEGGTVLTSYLFIGHPYDPADL